MPVNRPTQENELQTTSISSMGHLTSVIRSWRARDGISWADEDLGIVQEETAIYG
jgi:hypothetical protein